MSIIAQRPTHVRHIILWLTVLLYMVTYFDRVMISTAMPEIQKEFGFSTVTVGWIIAAFQISYSLFQIPYGTALGPSRGGLPAAAAPAPVRAPRVGPTGSRPASVR